MKQLLKFTNKSKWSSFVYFFSYFFICYLSGTIWNFIDYERDWKTSQERMGISSSLGTYQFLLTVFVIIYVLPIQIILTTIALIKYPGKVPLQCWNGRRPYWNIFWSLGTIVPLMYFPTVCLFDSLWRKEIMYHPELIILFFVSLHYALYLRASIVMSNLFVSTKDKL
jgi:hypothetical protein